MWSKLRFLTLILLIYFVSACTYAVNSESPPFPRFDSVHIVSKGATDELKARFGVTPDNSSAGVGAGVGAGAGMAAAAGASLACGPFVLLCALATMPTGALLGAAGGSLAGAAVDTQKRPPEDQLLILDKLFVEISQQRTIHREILEALEQQIPPGRLVDASEAGALLQLNLYDVRFMQDSLDEYSLTLQALLEAQWNRQTRHMRNGKRVYRVSSRSMPLDGWLQDGGKALNLAFDTGIERLVEQMVEDIRFTDLTAADLEEPASTDIF